MLLSFLREFIPASAATIYSWTVRNKLGPTNIFNFTIKNFMETFTLLL